MDSKLLKNLGNMDQLCGIREYDIDAGRGRGVHAAEVHTAAGLSFTVLPDLGMTIYDFRYRGINLTFHSKNGIVSPHGFSSSENEFAEQWTGGMLVTCGLETVGEYCRDGGNCLTHGRLISMPASSFGTEEHWERDDYVLRITGEVHQTRMYGRHISLRRTIETSLFGKSIRIHDRLTNFTETDEPYMLLYHCNFGYPLLSEESRVRVCDCQHHSRMNELAGDYRTMLKPVDGRGEELFMHSGFSDKAWAELYNPSLKLGGFVRFSTRNLPNMVEWKNMKSHDYVLAFEPCNTYGINRVEAKEAGKIAVLPAYSTIDNELEIGVIEAN